MTPGGKVPEDRAAVRRRDRAKDDAWVADFLTEAAAGVLATVDEGQPFLNSNLFVYDPERHAIYIHTARLGRTRSNLEGSERVAFTAFEMGRLLPADEALEFSVEYSGAVAFGRGTVVADPEEQTHGLQLLLDKYAPHLRPGEHYRPITAGELKRTGVYRIDIDEWSGKEKVAAADFPGAFDYEEVRGRTPADAADGADE